MLIKIPSTHSVTETAAALQSAIAIGAGSDVPVKTADVIRAVLMSASTVIVAINARLLRLKNDKPLKKGETT